MVILRMFSEVTDHPCAFQARFLHLARVLWVILHVAQIGRRVRGYPIGTPWTSFLFMTVALLPSESSRRPCLHTRFMRIASLVIFRPASRRRRCPSRWCTGLPLPLLRQPHAAICIPQCFLLLESERCSARHKGRSAVDDAVTIVVSL